MRPGSVQSLHTEKTRASRLVFLYPMQVSSFWKACFMPLGRFRSCDGPSMSHRVLKD